MNWRRKFSKLDDSAVLGWSFRQVTDQATEVYVGAFMRKEAGTMREEILERRRRRAAWRIATTFDVFGYSTDEGRPRKGRGAGG
jgi:hypothetical protein